MPSDRKLGPAMHGMIGAFYFYEHDSEDDAAFGFFDIELSVQLISATVIRVEVYCVADGYQSFRGVGADHPLNISVLAQGTVVGVAEWRFADVICGHADPMTFAAEITLRATTFKDINGIALEKVEGLSIPC